MPTIGFEDTITQVIFRPLTQTGSLVAIVNALHHFLSAADVTALSNVPRSYKSKTILIWEVFEETKGVLDCVWVKE